MLQAKTVTLTSVTSVIAIQAFNSDFVGGILVSDNYGQMLSGTASWKCVKAPVSGDWMLILLLYSEQSSYATINRQTKF
jgi:hypothetical protein